MELTVSELTKDFGKKRAVDHVSFALTPGVYGLLGPNGAGKTTLMKMMVDLLRPTQGRVLLDGVGIRELGAAYRDKLGYMPQEIGVYKNFSAQRFLCYIAALKGLSARQAEQKTARLLRLVGLQDAAKKKLGGFSGGMLRRVGIAQALLNDPSILILDEPTAGLDPQERIRLRNILSELAENRIVLLSTHIISDMEFIAGQVIMMRAGSILRTGTTAGLLRQMQGKVWLARIPHEALAEAKARYVIGNILQRPDGVELRIVADAPPALPCQPAGPVLEDVFSYYFGGAAL